MSAPYETINQPCNGPGTCSTTFRSVSFNVQNTFSTLAGSDNALAWVQRWIDNPSLWDDIPWGWTRYGFFNDAHSVEPDNLSDAQTGGSSYSLFDYYLSDAGEVIASTSEGQIAQIWIGGLRAYMVLATGWIDLPDGGASGVAVIGCTSVLPDNPGCYPTTLVTLPIPDVKLGHHCNMYIFTSVGTPPPTGPNPGVFPDMASFIKGVDEVPATDFTSVTCKPGGAFQ